MVKIRSYTYKNELFLTALQQKALEWEGVLNQNCIFPKDMYVWIKEYKGRFYLKIEIDICNQEVQYDLSCSFHINNTFTYKIEETHFKGFYPVGNNKWNRIDLNRNQANPTLQAVDTIIKNHENN